MKVNFLIMYSRLSDGAAVRAEILGEILTR